MMMFVFKTLKILKKNNCLVHFKQLKYMVYELYLIKADMKTKTGNGNLDLLLL